MSRCPFYKWEGGSWWGSMVCVKRNEKVTSDLEEEYCKWDKHERCPFFKDDNGSSGGCFLTTACVTHRGLPDDCHELTTLRRYRDMWLAKQPGGQELIDEYYRVAPGIVEKVNARADAADVWERVYQEHILPCVAAVEADDNERAKVLYLQMVDELRGLA